MSLISGRLDQIALTRLIHRLVWLLSFGDVLAIAAFLAWAVLS